jgi:hypothetical protein
MPLRSVEVRLNAELARSEPNPLLRFEQPVCWIARLKTRTYLSLGLRPNSSSHYGLAASCSREFAFLRRTRRCILA